jgi:hypothetical protein
MFDAFRYQSKWREGTIKRRDLLRGVQGTRASFRPWQADSAFSQE